MKTLKQKCADLHIDYTQPRFMQYGKRAARTMNMQRIKKTEELINQVAFITGEHYEKCEILSFFIKGGAKVLKQFAVLYKRLPTDIEIFTIKKTCDFKMYFEKYYNKPGDVIQDSVYYLGSEADILFNSL